jgi:hypothetical protein
MTTTNSTDSETESVSSFVDACEKPRRLRITRYRRERPSGKSLSYEDWIAPIEKSEGAVALRIPSGNGAHYILKSGHELVAVYAGPHGPENRPASIDERNIRELLDCLPDPEFVLTKNSRLANCAVSDLL